MVLSVRLLAKVTSNSEDQKNSSVERSEFQRTLEAPDQDASLCPLEDGQFQVANL